AMIVAGPEGFVKNQYRKFNIRSTDITPGDDFGMMREVMQRRFSRLVKEHAAPEPEAEGDDEAPGDAFPAWPDLILIDGGQGQMSAALAFLDELVIADKAAPIAAAKVVAHAARRQSLSAAGSDTIMSTACVPVMYFVQPLLYAANSFAFGSHRSRRSRLLV